MAIEHVNIADPEIHEPKGASTASNKQVYLADGAGSGSWDHLHGGWGNYDDNAAEQTFNTTAAKLSVNGSGSESNSSYLPRSIRGSAELWDTVDDKITPANVGDSYTAVINLPVTSRTSANYLELELDIGGGATPSTVLATKRVECDRAAPFNLSITLPFFCLSTFLTNGGQLFLKTDVGSVGVTAPSIFITQNFDGTN